MPLLLSVFIATTFGLVIHELGHLLMARCYQVKALEFGFGVGRRIFRVQLPRIAFALRIFPFGSFVMLDGTALAERSLFAQILIHLGGVMLNLAVGLMTYGTMFGWINLLLAAGNVLPLYHHDGWKCGVLIIRAFLQRKSQKAEWAFTFSGGFVSLLIASLAARVLM